MFGLSTIGSWIIGVAGAAILAGASYVGWDYAHQAKTIQSLKDQLSVSQSAVKVQEANVALGNRTIATLQGNLTMKLDAMSKSCALLQDVANDTDATNDEPVGGALGKILGKIDAAQDTLDDAAEAAPKKKSVLKKKK